MRKTVTRISMLLASSSIVASAAAAQTPASAPSSTSNMQSPSGFSIAATQALVGVDIIVTATRRAESLQDVPMSVDVATGQQLQRLNIFDAKDVQQLSPGLQLENQDGRSNRSSLRGITFDPDQGTDPAVDIYFNEVPADAQNTFTAIYDVDQIEVLRGPQGALRGRTSPAGAITIRTRRANLTRLEGYVQATGTDDHAYNLQGAISIPLINDVLAIRVAGLIDGNRLNQVRNVSRNGEFSRSRTESVRASIAFNPTPDVNLNLTYQYLHADNRRNQQVFGPGSTPFSPASICCSTIRSGPVIGSDDYLAVTEGLLRFRNSDQRVTLNGDWNMGPVTLSVVGGYQDSVLNQQRDSDVANAVPGYIGPENRDPGESPFRVPYKVKMGEVRLASNNEGFWNWGVSAYYYRQTGDVAGRTPTELFFSRTDPVPDLVIPSSGILIPVFSRTMAISANSRFQFTEKLRLEVAARYSDIKKRQTVYSGAFPLVDTPRHKKPLTGAANLTYEFTPDLTAYLAYGRSFRVGSTDVGAAIQTIVTGSLTDDLVNTQDEKSDSFEAGVKMAILDRRLSLNVAAFYQKFNDYLARFRNIPVQYGPIGGAPLPPVSSIRTLDFNYNADATIKGIEGTLAGRPTDNWDFSVSASYVKGRFDNAAVPCATFLPDGVTPVIVGGGNVSYCTTSRRLSDIPDFNLSANTEYRFSTGDFEPFIRALFTYRPSVFSEASNFDYRSRELLNLYVGIRGNEGRWEVNAFAKNLFNQKRVTFASIITDEFVAAGATPFQSGYRQINMTNPREFGATLSYRF